MAARLEWRSGGRATSHEPREAPESAGESHDRLDSWKELASYLNRGVRTVQRWEAEEGLPVHRLHHDKRGSVYASRAELDAWWTSRRRTLEAEPEVEQVEPADPEGALATPPATRPAARGTRDWRLVAAAAVVGVGVLVTAALWRIKVAPLTEKDTIVLADFANSTGDPVFDDTLKQGLDVSLRQSPFLNVLSDNKVSDTLRLMTRPKGTALTPDVASEVCQRAAGTAVISGSIASLGSQFVVGLKAVNCQSGDTLAHAQESAASKERVLVALGEATTSVRRQLGESLASVQKFDVPLALATTSSLDALKAFSLGRRAQSTKGHDEALPFALHAVELDPNFAMAYAYVGTLYGNLFQRERATEYWTKAYELRGHASRREQFAIDGNYTSVTGDLEKAVAIAQERIASYPRDQGAHHTLASLFLSMGQLEKAVDGFREALRIEPDNISPYNNLSRALILSNRVDEARKTEEDALSRKLDNDTLRRNLYVGSFLQGNTRAMAEQVKWFDGHPRVKHRILFLESQTAAYSGRMRQARELMRHAVESARRADNEESAAFEQIEGALREATFGNLSVAIEGAAAALALAPGSREVEARAALVYALAGDPARAQSVADHLATAFPQDTLVKSLWLPVIRSQVAVARKNPVHGIELLPAVRPYERGNYNFVGCMYPAYVRGHAYLAAQQGDAAAAEFQRFLDNPGLVWNCPTGVLAHLGLARAYALVASTTQGADADTAKSKSRAAYQTFLTLWKDADPDIPILRAARAESAAPR
jgi:eukaryotic-like serine/threonine-protein kinase